MTLLTYRKFAHRVPAARAARECAGEVDLEMYAAEREDFGKFWIHVMGADKPPALHHRAWIKLIQTDQDSAALAKVAGPNLEIRGPRDSAKSTFAYLLAAWIVGWNPGGRMLYISYSDAIALEQSRKIKRLIQSPRYREVFPWIRIGKRRNASDWEVDKAYALNYPNLPDRVRISSTSDVDATYTLYAAGALGSIMGKRADICICDDLVKSAEAIAAPEVRAKMLDNVNGVIEPCVVNGARWIDVGMLARRDDIHLSFFTEENGFFVHTTSAIQRDEAGRERSYWPERHPLESLQQRRRRSPHIFGLQFQNEAPQDEEAAIILSEWIRWGHPPESFDELVLSVDLAATEKQESDFTALLLLGKVRSPLQYWVLSCDLFKESGNVAKLKRISKLRRALGRRFRVVVERGAYQNSFEGDWRDYVNEQDSTLSDCPVSGVAVSRDLRERLTATSGVIENGHVRFADNGPGLHEVVHQITNAHTDDLDHDDAASALAQGLSKMMGRGSRKVWTA